MGHQREDRKPVGGKEMLKYVQGTCRECRRQCGNTFIHGFSQYLLSTCHVPSTGLEARVTVVNKTDKGPALMELTV